MNKIIAVSGGIGTGKSIICRILRNLDYHVYDCDIHAKMLMDQSIAIKQAISTQINSSVIENGKINRERLGKIVFNDKCALDILNKIVHDAVKADILNWQNNFSENILFIETAILYQSGIDKMVDEVWNVSAPIETRITRVMKRNGLNRNEVIARINSQNYNIARCHPNTYSIINDDYTPVIPQIFNLINHNI